MDSFLGGASMHVAAAVVVDVTLKATVILGLAWLATTALRQASAAVRHGVWSLALAGLLLLPLLSTSLPAWHIELPEAIRPLLSYTTTDQASRPSARTSEFVAPVLQERSASAASVLDARGKAASSREAPAIEAAAAPTRSPGVSWPTWIVLVWSAGVLLLLGRLGLHVLRVGLLARRAMVLTDARRIAEITRLAQGLGIRRRLRVLRSPEVSMAMTWGLRRPVVMLPHQASGWPADRLRVVVLHELAHVKRVDYLIHLLTQLVRALYWFNPLVWLAARRIHVEQERACDDQVLRAGAGACDYAAHLLDIARTYLKRPRPLPGGIAMVRGSTLKERVRAILNARSKRHALSLRGGLAAVGMGACLILPVATLQLGLPAPHDPLPGAGMHHDDPAVWHQAALAPELERTTLIDLLRHSDPTLRGRAAWALGERKDPEAVDPLLESLVDDEAAVRVQVVRALGALENRKALDSLDARLRDPCSAVRRASVRALEKICRCHALEVLPAALTDPSPQVRMTAAYVLGETIRGLRADDSVRARRALRDHLRPAVRALVDALDDVNAVVRQRVAHTLGEARDVAAVDALTAAVRDASPAVRLEAVRAIGKIGLPCTASAVRPALDDRDPEVRATAARVLDQLDAARET